MKIPFRIVFLVVFLTGFIADAFFVKLQNTYTDWGADARLFLLLTLWVIIAKASRYTSTATFKLTLAFLTILSFFFIFFRGHPSIERLASWVYIYMATGVIQQLFEARRGRPLRGRNED